MATAPGSNASRSSMTFRRIGEARHRYGGLTGAAGPRRPSRGARLRDEGAAAHLAHDLALGLQCMHGFADGIAAGVELRFSGTGKSNPVNTRFCALTTHFR